MSTLKNHGKCFNSITDDPSAGMSLLSDDERNAVETLAMVLQSGHDVAPDRGTTNT